MSVIDIVLPLLFYAGALCLAAGVALTIGGAFGLLFAAIDLVLLRLAGRIAR
jgi:hypothetical protein